MHTYHHVDIIWFKPINKFFSQTDSLKVYNDPPSHFKARLWNRL